MRFCQQMQTTQRNHPGLSITQNSSDEQDFATCMVEAKELFFTSCYSHAVRFQSSSCCIWSSWEGDFSCWCSSFPPTLFLTGPLNIALTLGPILNRKQSLSVRTLYVETMKEHGGMESSSFKNADFFCFAKLYILHIAGH